MAAPKNARTSHASQSAEVQVASHCVAAHVAAACSGAMWDKVD
eukprot:CAMPEP_0204521164 /NCGR_PEP_ID=MMETSP0661-20131031/5644_1 /ASSEMBLY_ACC=CAM_ASM_000606 /TAXON_ID=109239 /ORGANISM="Alexandrium margalefi, Strain AMGDE01CS-322" /LENGTH=42 /DNA_ID= /DNA_START= /DNA_END= /DNA_ORIENTATION=